MIFLSYLRRFHHRLWVVLVGDGMLRDATLALMGNGLLSLSAFVTIVVLSRSLAPDQQGRFAIVATLASIVQTVSSSGFDTAFVRVASQFRNDAAAMREISRTFLSAKLVGNLLIMGVGWLVAPIIANGYGDVTIAPLLRIAVLGVFGFGLNGHLVSILIARLQFGRLLIAHASFSLITIAAIFSLAAYQQLTVAGAVMVATLAPLVAFGIAVAIFPDLIRFRVELKSHWLQRLRLIGPWIFLVETSSILTARLDVLLLGLFVGIEDVGYYYPAKRVLIFVPLGLSALTHALLPRVASLHSFEQLRRYVGQAFKYSGLSVLLLFPVLWWLGGYLPMLLGSPYAPSVSYFRLITLGMALVVLLVPLSQVFHALNRQDLLFRLTAMQILVLTGCAMMLIPRFGALGIIYSSYVAYSVTAVQTLLYLKQSLFSGQDGKI